jgi:hypothetical protein
MFAIFSTPNPPHTILSNTLSATTVSYEPKYSWIIFHLRKYLFAHHKQTIKHMIAFGKKPHVLLRGFASLSSCGAETGLSMLQQFVELVTFLRAFERRRWMGRVDLVGLTVVESWRKGDERR